MGDFAKSGISVGVEFVTGEAPSAQKLSAITSQTRRGLSQVEKILGDAHGDSYPYTSASDTTLSSAWGRNPVTGLVLSGAEERRLDIANIARLIGPAGNLNPKMIAGSQEITEDTPVGVHEFALKYPPSGDTEDITTDDPSLTDFVGNATNLLTAGEYSINNNGKVRSVTATAGGTITYTIDPTEWASGVNYSTATFNVLPDPNQSVNGDGVSIGSIDGNGRRLVSLPLITHQQSDIDGLSIELDEDDANFERQLKLPRVLTQNLVSGDEIPAGFLYLRNETTGEFYVDGTYFFNDDDSILVGNVDIADDLTAGHVFSLITIGTDITTSIDDLRNKTRHSHNRDLGEPFVDISGIIGQYELPGASGPFTQSEIDGNYFSQYLHRDGFRSGVDENINDSNCMRGDLVFGVVDGDAGAYLSATGESYGIRFGNGGAARPRIYKDDNEDMIISNEDGDLIIETNNPVLNKTLVNNVLRATYGIVGDTVGTVGLISNGLAPFATQGVVTTNASFASVPVEITLSSAIKATTWYSVSLSIEIPGVAGGWITNGTFASGGNIVGTHAPDELGFIYWFIESGGETTLHVSFSNDVWAANTAYDYRLVIWYQPA